MNCPNCNTLCRDDDRYCYLCGAALQSGYIPPKPRKGSRLVPALILLLLSVTGLVFFFATSGRNTPIRAEGSSPWFYVRDGVLYFESHRYTGGSKLEIPEAIAGQVVHSLSEDCFADCTDLTEIILPDTINTIGEGAFRGCTSLRGINLPDSVNIIAEEAFKDCIGMEAIRIPATIHTIRSDAFDNCESLIYIFYGGTYQDWMNLYSQYINPYTAIYCQDGSFFQGGIPNK